MSLTFYFEIPDKLDVENEDQPPHTGVGWCQDYGQTTFSTLFYRSCKKKYPDLDIKHVNSVGFNYLGERIFVDKNKTGPTDPVIMNPNGLYAKYSWPHIIIQNDETGKYLLITCGDQLRRIKKGVVMALNPDGTDDKWVPSWDWENCVEIFTMCGVQDNERSYNPLDIEYTPVGGVAQFWSAEQEIQRLYKESVKNNEWGVIGDKPRFKGAGGYGQDTEPPVLKEDRGHFRHYLHDKPPYPGDDRFEMSTDRISAVDMMKWLNEYSFNIDINGAAEASCRTYEIMGLGRALIRPKLAIKHHNDLVPDYHYAEVKCDDLSNFKELADAYIERWEDLKKDPDFVRFLAENGRKWYEENGTMESMVKIFDKVVDLRTIL
jgi:hypothetical protein